MKTEDSRNEAVKTEEFSIRLLHADEIECRVASISEKGASLLLFKDARVDLKVLDETFGTFGWQRTHQTIDGNLYCTISLWDEKKKQWIAKQDVKVARIGYNEKREIDLLEITDSYGKTVFSLNPDKGENKTALKVLQKELDRTGVEMETVLERYHLQDISQMTPEQFENAINCLKKSKDRAA